MRKKIRKKILPILLEDIVPKKYIKIREKIFKKVNKNFKRTGTVKCPYCPGRIKYQISIDRSMHVMCKCGVNWFEEG